MTRLFGIIYAMGGTTLAGSAMVLALATGHDTAQAILLSAGIGAVAAIPICWSVTKRIARA